MEKILTNWKITSDGEANFFGIANDKNWLMRIQFNGEIEVPIQLKIMNLISNSPKLLNRIHELKELINKEL